jgi:hypothetical protein
MIVLMVYPYNGWQKDYARFEATIERRKLKVTECASGKSEILISVLTVNSLEDDLVSEAARKHFGTAYAGQL